MDQNLKKNSCSCLHQILVDFRHYISQGKNNCSIATQLRCGGAFSNHFITNFPQMRRWKNLSIGQYLAKIWTKVCGLLFWGHPVVTV